MFLCTQKQYTQEETKSSICCHLSFIDVPLTENVGVTNMLRVHLTCAGWLSRKQEVQPKSQQHKTEHSMGKVGLSQSCDFSVSKPVSPAQRKLKGNLKQKEMWTTRLRLFKRYLYPTSKLDQNWDININLVNCKRGCYQDDTLDHTRTIKTKTQIEIVTGPMYT